MAIDASRLSKIGLSNYESRPLAEYRNEDLSVTKYKYRALCTSYTCYGYDEYGGKEIIGVLKTAVTCPNCHSALVWEKYV